MRDRRLLRWLSAVAAALGFATDFVRGADFVPPRGFVDRYCADCHSGPTAESAFDVTTLQRDLSRPEILAKWVRVHDRIARGEMPPKDAPQLPGAERTAFVRHLAQALTEASAAKARTVLRRLNRTEYETTLNDLLGTHESLAELLPEDGTAHGFDNVGEALDVSAVHLERYLQAAEKALHAAVHKEPRPERVVAVHGLGEGRNAENLGKHWLERGDGAVVVFNNGGFPRPVLSGFKAVHEGLYRVRLKGYAFQSETPVACDVWQGNFGPEGRSWKLATFDLPPGPVSTHEATVHLKPGATFAILPQLQLDFAALRRDGPAAYKGRGLAIREVEIEGPLIGEWPGRGHRLLFGDLPTREIEPADPQVKKKPWYKPRFEIVSTAPLADAERLLRIVLPRLYRRPIVDGDVAPLLSLARRELDGGSNFEEALRTAYAAALCSPDFLYLREPREGPLDGFALASRLSYGCWNTSPDEELTRLAQQGRLAQPEVLRAQAERLLADPRSERFVRTFTGQWLGLRDIDFTMPDRLLYPEYDDALRDAMLAETEGFFAEILRGNRSLLEFVDSDWTVLNERLAVHYGLFAAGGTPSDRATVPRPLVAGREMRTTKLPPGSHRGGVLAHASVLKVSANGTTTSPVTRGAWVLERLLGSPPPPPPPGVPGVEPDIRGATTLRALLDKHRSLPSCNNCHRTIDPPGFALENYDVTGGWREHYRVLDPKRPSPPAALTGGRTVRWRVGLPVDASGTTADGATFRDLADYKRILLSKPDVPTRALVERVAVYLAGREVGFSDRPEIDRVAQSVASKGHGFRDLLHEVVQSSVFRNK